MTVEQAPPRDQTHIKAHALYDALRTREGPEAFLMAANGTLLKKTLLAMIPDEYKQQMADSIAAAAVILKGIKRRDGTPHLHHVLRAGIRSLVRRFQEDGELTPDSIEKAEILTNHDSQEDGRKEKKMLRSEIRRIYFSFVKPQQRAEKLYKGVELFDQYNDAGKELPEYEQQLKDAGLGPEKMDDTVDSMIGDMAKATTALKQDNLEIIISVYRDLSQSQFKTQRRTGFFEEQLTPMHKEQLRVYVQTAGLFLKELEAKIPEGQLRDIQRALLEKRTRKYGVFVVFPPAIDRAPE